MLLNPARPQLNPGAPWTERLTWSPAAMPAPLELDLARLFRGLP